MKIILQEKDNPTGVGEFLILDRSQLDKFEEHFSDFIIVNESSEDLTRAPYQGPNQGFAPGQNPGPNNWQNQGQWNKPNQGQGQNQGQGFNPKPNQGQNQPNKGDGPNHWQGQGQNQWHNQGQKPYYNQPIYNPHNLGYPPSKLPSYNEIGMVKMSDCKCVGCPCSTNKLKLCLYRMTYVWLYNGKSFWCYPTFVNANTVSGWKWINYRWQFFSIDASRISNFYCYK